MMTISRRLRLLVLAIAAPCVIAGCKIDVVVDLGGSVKSASGTRNCQEGNTCTFDVTDTKFVESFQAVPLPGYKFVKWQGGASFLCPNSASPNCTLTTTLFAGNAAVEAIIASSTVFTIKPVFIVIPPRKYIVKDGKGVVLGEVTDFNYETVTVRLLHVDEARVEHGYLLAFANDAVKSIRSNTLVWSNATCSGENAFMLLPARYHFMEPLISNTFQVINESPEGNGIFSLVKIAPAEQAQQLVKPYSKYGDVCQPWGGSAKGVPATIILPNLGARFTPPFGLYFE
jgi:hypothetical protein